MTPDAKLRMDVYQEGQRSTHLAPDQCPYTDWRRGTWNKGRNAALKYREAVFQPAEVPAAPPVVVPRELFERLLEHHYNPFEPGNQDALYLALKACE